MRFRLRRQKLGRYVAIQATCSEDCFMRATGMLTFSRKEPQAARARLIGTRRSARAGTRVRLRLRLSNRVLQRARKAMRAKRRVSARVTLIATDAAGNTTRKRTRSRLSR
jgi:hypothetical protein